MKATLKPLSWLFTFFNAFVYNLSDHIDSLMQQLFEVGLQNHAESIIQLSHHIAWHQSLIVGIEVLKLVVMIITLIFMFFAHRDNIEKSLVWIGNQIIRIQTFTNKFKKPKS
jgi:hypothetical protein